VISVLPLGFTKLAVLLFYRRIFPGRLLNILFWAMICLTCIWMVGFFFSQLLQCIPISLNWGKFGNLTDQCINVDSMILAEAWSDDVSNIIILMLPIPSVSLSISRRFLTLNCVATEALSVTTTNVAQAGCLRHSPSWSFDGRSRHCQARHLL